MPPDDATSGITQDSYDTVHAVPFHRRRDSNVECSRGSGARTRVRVVEITYRYGGSDMTARARPQDADAAVARLNEGSRAIAALLEGGAGATSPLRRTIDVDPRDLGLGPRPLRAPEQRPFAAVLGCSDARVPIELLFNEGPNDLFVVRVAGNGLGGEVFGSLSYAVEHLGGSLKLVVVLGHSGCGAVSAAVDAVLNPETYLTLAEEHALRGILDRLLVVVHASAKKLIAVHGLEVTRHGSYREALIEATVVSNAALTAYTVQRELSTRRADLRAAYGVYLLAERRIWAPRHDSSECTGLAYPPADPAAFREFADRVVQSERIGQLLADGDDSQ